jgi:hypothetical protein
MRLLPANSTGPSTRLVSVNIAESPASPKYAGEL